MRYGKRFSEEDLKRLQSRKAKARRDSSVSSSNLEPDAGDEPLAEEKAARFTSPVKLLVHSFRHRLADADGLSVKACLDQCVKEGILADDTTAHLEEVRFRQTKIPKSEEEKTELIFY